MHIIPVIDLLNGVVVHAKQGQRHQYQPIQSALTASCKPLDIVKAFNEIYPFDTLYIADLNAIQRLPGVEDQHRTIIETILDAFPQLAIWIDAGIRQISDLRRWQQSKTTVIIGTENMPNMNDYKAIQQMLADDFVLSLDFMPSGYQGPSELIQQYQTWPQKVIVMTLNQVGSQSGVDIAKLHQILKQAHQQHIYAAGGVRNVQDLTQLRDMHVHGALVASALHAKQITNVDLHALSVTGTKKPG